MPRKKTVKVEEAVVYGPKLEEWGSSPTQEPQKHIVQIKRKTAVPNIGVVIDVPVGEIRYWESTDDITYSYEAGYQIYMDNFVNRSIEIAKNKWIDRQSTRKWVENLPNAILIDGYFASDILTMAEVE